MKEQKVCGGKGDRRWRKYVGDTPAAVHFDEYVLVTAAAPQENIITAI